MGGILYGLMAIVIGVAVSLAVYWAMDRLLHLLPLKVQDRLMPIPFLLPAATLVTVVLLYPMVQTFVLSFKNGMGTEWVGFDNYKELFTSRDFLDILLNNFLWVAVVPASVVVIGLLVATLSNQVGPTREKVFKSLIFMPMSISFVSAATIWRFLYVYVPDGRGQIGLLNAILYHFHITTQPWLTIDKGRLNSFLLMIIMIWLQAGFSTVLLSAAIKAVPEETLEAARIDGANARQVFFQVVVPQIRGSIMAVFITVLIGVMKVFDIVLAMTGGNFKTSVLGFQFYQEFFLNANGGKASAIVVVLTLLISPLMWLQIRTARHQESLR